VGIQSPALITTALLMVTKLPVDDPWCRSVILAAVMLQGFSRPFVLLLILATWWACDSSDRSHVTAEGLGGRHYGGVFSFNGPEPVNGLHPLGITQLSAHRIASQIYEGLVRIDGSDLGIRPALATSWEVDSSGTVYTFTLRSGVRFHDNACFDGGRGRVMTADDVLRCFTALCTPGPGNHLSWVFQDLVLGAGARINAVLSGQPPPPVRGLEVLDDGRFRITLRTPSATFLQVLTHQGCWIYPHEMHARHGDDTPWNPVGTGPFRLRALKQGISLVLERNTQYWDKDELGNQLPFLDGVRVTFELDRTKEREAFSRGRLTYLSAPDSTSLDALVLADGERPLVLGAPGMSVQFYGFAATMAPFQDPRVRRAFSLAIDRTALVDTVLGGAAVPAERGVVPPGFRAYPYDSVPALTYDPELAMRLLRDAGYASGSDLPPVTLQVNSDGPAYGRVANAVQVMLERNLGAKVVISVLPSDQHFGRVERGRAQFWREGWVADHPDPENFLSIFHGRNAPADTSEPSFVNSTRYRNDRFDECINMARSTMEPNDRMRLLARCERILMADMVVMPIYHERVVCALQPWVRDLPINGMDILQLRSAWHDHQDQ
jgi:oligopeptide transport system substrate-binding protein